MGKKIHRHLETPKIDSIMSYSILQGHDTNLVSSYTEIVAFDDYVLSFQRIWNYFVAEMWIILGVGTWPTHASMSKFHMGTTPTCHFLAFPGPWIF